MTNIDTKSTPGAQDSNFTGQPMGDSPALAALKAKVTQQSANPNPQPQVQNTQQNQSSRRQVETNDIFSQISRAVEPGLFDHDIPLTVLPSSNDSMDYQQPQVQNPNQPPRQIATQQQDLQDALNPLPNQVLTPTQQPMQTQKPLVDPNLLGQPGDSLEQRYSDSSREAKKLALENAQLKKQVDAVAPVMPLILKLKESESLRNMVNGYYKNGGVTPQDVQKMLELPDDFVFDGDEAFRNPKSDSAKVLATTIDMAATARAEKVRGQIMSELKAEQDRIQALSERQKFQTANNITSEQMSELDNFMLTHNVTLEDIWYLKNRGSREQNIASNVQKDVINQMHNVRDVMPTTMNGVSEVPLDPNSERAIFQLAFPNTVGEKGIFDI